MSGELNLETPWDVSIQRRMEWVQLQPQTDTMEVQIVGSPTEAPPGDEIGGIRSQVFCTVHGSVEDAERIARFIVRLVNRAVAAGERP
jgi:hypothetical protein